LFVCLFVCLFEMNYFVLTVVVFLAVIAASDEVNPGLRSTVSNGGLEYAKSVLQPILIEQVKGIKIPDMEDKVHSPVGKIKIELSNIHLSEFGLEQSSITLTPPNEGVVSLSGLSVHLEFNWHYKAKFASDHGSGEAHTSGASTKVSAGLSKDDKGAPVVTIDDTGFDCGDLSIKLHGGASWLYNVLISAFKGKIRSAVNTEVRKQITSTISDMIQKALASVPLSYDFDNGMSLSYALADDPAVLPDYGGRMAAGSVAEFYVTKEGPGHSPFKPTAMPKTTATSAPGPMVELFMNEFFFNTLSYSYIHSGNSHWQIDEDNAPVEAKPLLISGYYASAAPGLIDKYGLDAPLRVEFEVEQIPTLYIQPDVFQLQTSASLTMEVNQNQTFTKVIGLDATLLTAGVVSLNDTAVTGNLKTLKINATVTSSTVGDVDIKGMQDLIDFTATFATNTINERLAQGVPLPVVKGISFVDPKIIWGSNYVAITSSFSYKPQL